MVIASILTPLTNRAVALSVNTPSSSPKLSSHPSNQRLAHLHLAHQSEVDRKVDAQAESPASPSPPTDGAEDGRGSRRGRLLRRRSTAPAAFLLDDDGTGGGRGKDGGTDDQFQAPKEGRWREVTDTLSSYLPSSETSPYFPAPESLRSYVDWVASHIPEIPRPAGILASAPPPPPPSVPRVSPFGDNNLGPLPVSTSRRGRRPSEFISHFPLKSMAGLANMRRSSAAASSHDEVWKLLDQIDDMSCEEDTAHTPPLEDVEEECEHDLSGGGNNLRRGSSWTSFEGPPDADPASSEERRRRRDAELASRLAGRMIRATRDAALDEAQELSEALVYWRWRHGKPRMSYLQAGPRSWASGGGFAGHRAAVGQRAGQIQAVLARRIAAVGELQQHILRAGWQRGVSRWGVLGQGKQWTAVEGTGDGGAAEGDGGAAAASAAHDADPLGDADKRPSYYGLSDLVVDSRHDSRINRDAPALAAWSVDALRLVRDHLHRARGEPLSAGENWPLGTPAAAGVEGGAIPNWASFRGGDVVIVDLKEMAGETAQLLECMEAQVATYRRQRLHGLRPPSRIARNWYVVALAAPASGYLMYRLMKEKLWITLAVNTYAKLGEFFQEHMLDPFQYIFTELFTSNGRKKIHDHEALASTIDSLKGMLEKWMTDCFPEMDKKEMTDRVNRMDLSLIEEEFEKQVPSAVTNFPNLLRVSLIEMQFIKKELMLAMNAIDDLLDSNEFNFRTMATVPAWMLFMVSRWGLRGLYYFINNKRTSKAETHWILRARLLDLERLLVIRDGAPPAPPPLTDGVLSGRADPSFPDTPLSPSPLDTPSPKAAAPADADDRPPHRGDALGRDDLGMVVLLVHGCRTMLLKNRSRFNKTDQLNVWEDLAELAGERGPVSIRQQLAVISRMRRTYKFLAPH